jgi:hypothetical protein
MVGCAATIFVPTKVDPANAMTNDPAAHNTNRVGVGTGVFTLGSHREIEFSLKIAF